MLFHRRAQKTLFLALFFFHSMNSGIHPPRFERSEKYNKISPQASGHDYNTLRMVDRPANSRLVYYQWTIIMYVWTFIR